MRLRRNLKVIYISVIVTLTVSTIAALWDGGYDIAGGLVAGLALASIITSFLPFFISMHLFKKHESNSDEKKDLKIIGLIIYTFCFPVKSWIIYSNVVLLINGGDGWAFG